MHIGAASERRRHDVAILRVGQVESRNEGFVAGHYGAGKVLIHRLSNPFQLVAGQVRPLEKKVVDPLGMDVGAPQRIEQALVRET